MKESEISAGFEEMMKFGLVEALLGRRSRRFFMGAEIPDGVFTYKSRRKEFPLTDLEKMLVVSACGGNTSWHHMIYRAARYALAFPITPDPRADGYIPRPRGFTQARFSSRTTKAYICWKCAMHLLSVTGRMPDHWTRKHLQTMSENMSERSGMDVSGFHRRCRTQNRTIPGSSITLDRCS